MLESVTVILQKYIGLDKVRNSYHYFFNPFMKNVLSNGRTYFKGSVVFKVVFNHFSTCTKGLNSILNITFYLGR